MLKKILIAFAALVALALLVGALLPSSYRVERSTVIHAPPEAVYGFVASLERWRDWAPWDAKRYPGSDWVTAGPAVGAGAVRSWSGQDVGPGTLRLTEADPSRGVVYDASVANGHVVHGRISLAPEGAGTRVTWVDEGALGGNPLMHYLVPPVQRKLGADLEEGLARLAKLVEAAPPPAAAKPEPTEPQAAAPTKAPEPVPTPAPMSAPVTAHPEEAPATQASAPAAGTEPPPAATGTPPPSTEPAPAPTQAESAPVNPTPAPAPAAEQVTQPQP